MKNPRYEVEKFSIFAFHFGQESDIIAQTFQTKMRKRTIGVYAVPAHSASDWQKELLESEPKGEVYKPVIFYIEDNGNRVNISGIARYWFAPRGKDGFVMRVGFYLPDSTFSGQLTQDELDRMGNGFLMDSVQSTKEKLG